ncbi:type II and III secretion system protein family protein [Polymorphobacter sp. PAMC 29334]|uniref:type II and III secretion system protein family protein n=1 Tax=Polymorphobacter sp. PAMC 29334 TaxID=2862331 RepID=UPI001C67D119|nr:type II and III secretion system protein family protein [Polymorphobacter sp. PAMC 29334]QYE36587.1 type II and III secretion system protein family protein [Polymorphobacter sp. PAMC 29334]
MALIVAAVFASIRPSSATAQVASLAGLAGQQLAVVQGKSQLLRIGRPFAQVLIGDPAVADILPMNGDTIYVLGKKIGTTNLTVYDRSHTLVAVIDLAVGPDAAGLRTQLAALLPDEKIGVRPTSDSLLLEGTVSNAVVAERAMHLAEVFAPGKAINFLALGAPQQVLLEVRFSEMQRSTARSLGIRTLALSNSGNFSSQTGSTSTDSTATIGGSFGIGAVNINVALDALEQKGLVTTLAQPNLVALSGETASFLAGGEFPVPIASSPATAGAIATITVAPKEFGVSLGFTPTVLADGMINLVVAPEVSAIDPAASITLNSIVIPGLRTRRAKTTLELRDGESFAIAGLIGADFADTIRQVPLLGSLPIIGALFRSTRFDRSETELVITVTPHLVHPVKPEALHLPTEQFRAPDEASQFLLGARQAPHEVKP